MARSLMAVLVFVGLAACSGAERVPLEPTTPPPTTSTSSPSTQPLTAAGCPVRDEAFCDTAVGIGQALLRLDTDGLLRLSRPDTIECARVRREYFPGCGEADVLRGHGVSGVDFVVQILPRDDYAERLDAVVGGIDPSASDDLGSGGPRVIGVGTCGPDIPGRRTYHVAWTAIRGSDGRRILASFEVLFQDDRWRIGLWYVDAFVDWEAEFLDPMTMAFCEAGQSPWGA